MCRHPRRKGVRQNLVGQEGMNVEVEEQVKRIESELEVPEKVLSVFVLFQKRGQVLLTLFSLDD